MMVASQHAIVVGESMHSCVNTDSLTGGPVETPMKNGIAHMEGKSHHYTDAAARASNERGWYSAV